jgi:uncharacterized protein YkwD
MNRYTCILISLLLAVHSAYGQKSLERDSFPKKCIYFEKRLFELVNDYRVKNGLKPVLWSEQVHQATDNHAFYLTKIEGLNHYQSKNVEDVAEKKGFMERITYYVPNPSMVGEIIAQCSYEDFKDSAYINSVPAAALELWKKSKRHNEIILTAAYTQGAVSIYQDKDRNIKPVFIFVRR